MQTYTAITKNKTYSFKAKNPTDAEKKVILSGVIKNEGDSIKIKYPSNKVAFITNDSKSNHWNFKGYRFN